MAPVKFEDNLREKLEKRTIQPSSDAWSRLENRLDKSTEQKSTKPFWMLGIAASIIGVLLVTNLFFKSEQKPINNETKVVKEDTAIEVFNQNETSIAVEDRSEALQIQNENNVVKLPSKIAQKTNYEKKSVSPNRAVEQPLIETVATVSESPNEAEKFKSFEDAKVDEVVAQVQELISKNQSVTEQEIDSLLDIAQQQLDQQKTSIETTATVDAMALLQGIENDLDKSFRNRVLETLISGVENVATAVAQRNN